MATKALARWATELTPTSLPASVKHAALRSLYNYIGCTIAGSTHPAVAKARDALSPLFGQPTASLLGYSEGSTSPSKADAQHAALLNGIASHVHDYDDTYLATVIHPTGPVASALLAYVEHVSATRQAKVTGEDLLCALVAGIEAEIKLGLAIWPSHYDVGWHITSTVGTIGAAVGVGKLMQLIDDGGFDEQKMAFAIGIAAVQMTGLREMFGTDTKPFHVGRAAQTGLVAAMLALGGFTSSEQALEAKRGWANVVTPGTPQLDRYITGDEGLGKTWEVERNAFKPFPCGIVCHPAIDGCIQVHQEMKQAGCSAEDIEKVNAKVHPLTIELTSKRKPRDGLEGKFSVFHGMAVGLLYGKAGPAEYTDVVVRDGSVVDLRDRTDAIVDDKTAADEVLLSVRFKNGKVWEKHVEHAIGSLKKPMSDQQLTEKFVDQVSLVLGAEAAKRASAAAWKFGDTSDVAKVLKQL